MSEAFDAFRFDLGIGRVATVYPESWEVDLEAEDGGVVDRAMVVGSRLPEESTGDRPQWCVFGYASHQHGRAVCWPMESRLPGPRTARAGLVEYDEILNWRFTIDRSGNLELRNLKGEQLLALRIQEAGGVVRLDTPHARVVLKEEDQSVEVHCAKTLTASCKDAEVQALGTIKATAGASATVTAPTIKLEGNVQVTGSLSVGASVTVAGGVAAGGSIIDAGGNTNHHSHS